MSQYTDWFIADENEAERLSREEDPFHAWPNLQMKNVIDCHCWDLFENLLGKRVDFEPLIEEFNEEEGVFVNKIPGEAVNALADLDKKSIEALSHKLVTSESFEGWPETRINDLLLDLNKFAKNAKKKGKAILQLSSF